MSEGTFLTFETHLLMFFMLVRHIALHKKCAFFARAHFCEESQEVMTVVNIGMVL